MIRKLLLTLLLTSPLVAQQSNYIFKPATVMTASGQTSTAIPLATSWTAGTVTVTGSGLTTATFAVQGSSDGGASYYTLPIYSIASPGTTATTATATADGAYQLNLAGLTHIRFVTSGTFTATNISLLLTVTPTGMVARSGGGGSGVTSVAAGTWPSWLAPTITNPSTTPSIAVAASAIPNTALATQTANTVLGALTGTTPSGLALPSCSSGANALTWTTGTGFGCNSITTAAGITGGAIGSLPYQSAASTTLFVTGNTAATDQVLTSTGTGSAAQAPTLKNAPALSAANMTSFPTLNQNTSGTAAGLSTILIPASGGTGISTSASTGVPQINAGTWTVSTTLPSGLSATNMTLVTPALGTPSAIVLTNATGFPTLNQSTSGTAANLSGTPALPNGTTGTTQTLGSADTKLSTDAYVDGFVVSSMVKRLTADMTCGTGGTNSSCTAATTVTGLTWTLPSSAQTWHFTCDLVVGQATAVTANQWLVQTATNGATNLEASYDMLTAATAVTGGAITGVASTTTAQQITPSWTLGATGTKMPVHIQGTIEGASGSGTVLNIQVIAPTVADLLTIYRGSSCRVW